MARKRAPNQESTFLDDILASPEDDIPRLIYADWLEDHGQPQRAEFIRLQCQLATLDEDDPGRLMLKARERELLAGHGAEWAQKLPAWARKERYEFRRGFVGWASLTLSQFLRQGEALSRATPLQAVQLRAAERRADELSRSPLLGRLSGLDLKDHLLIGADIEALLTSSHSDGITDLHLSGNRIGAEGVAALASWPHLDRLRTLDLSGNWLFERDLRPLLEGPPLERLTHFRRAGNFLRMSGLRALATSSRLVGLTHLDLHYCSLGPEVAELLASTTLPRVSNLDLSVNDFSAEQMRALSGVPLLRRLTSLQMCNCHLDDDGARALADSPNLENLRRLDLYHNKIEPAGAAALARGQFPSLFELRLPDNLLGAEGARALAGSTGLAGLLSLSLSRNNLGPEGAHALASSSRLDGLRFLHLGSNKIGSAGARALADWSVLAGLLALDLSNNEIDNEGIRALAASPHLANLRELNLSWNKLDAEGVLALAASRHLSQVRILTVGGSSGQHSLPPEAMQKLAESPLLPNLIALSDNVPSRRYRASR
jgi:uncharacterized protein (TIGR02996 family)